MEQLFQYLPERLTESLGWTLIHNLWQASVIGGLYFLVIKSLSVYYARIRYTLSVLALLSILGTSVLTYILTCRFHAGENISWMGMITGQNNELIPSLISETERTDAPLRGILPEGINYFVRYFNQIVFIWIAGIMIFTLKTAGGLYLVNRYRTRKVMPVSTELAQRMNIIRMKLKINRPVKFLISYLAEVPMVIGILKPVVLIPASAITGLAIAHLEAVLTHELAHISRHDYLVNLIQSIIEILFFYHPAVWLISRQTRIERELCCDDVSVSACETPGAYASALASIASMRLVPSHPCIALTNDNTSLYYRIRRILKKNTMDRKNYNRLMAGVLILAAAIIVITGTGMKFNISPAGARAVMEPAITQASAVSTLVPLINRYEPDMTRQDTSITVKDNKVTRTISHQDGETENVDITIRNGIVQELVINGRSVPEDRVDEYRELVAQTMFELQMMEEELRHDRRELDGIDFNKLQYELQKESEYLREEIKMELEHVRQELQNIQIELPEINIDLDSLKVEIEREMRGIEIDREKIMQEMERAMEKAREALEEVDMEQIREEIAEAMEEIEKIDQEEIYREIERMRESIKNINQEQIGQEMQEALQQIKQIDIQEIQHSIQKAIQDVMDEKEGVEQEKKRIDEMIKEIEKLEIEDK